ncbi:adenylate/guanylate cyclase domain-containing protein [Alteromonas aestuariivivens]|uniref:Adenylate/guanylate cyclase domain-containing protein n=1 Tax=Alteromonas aestuariivivens TaxID=1938339 RepID=A0A3D8MA34_9ALTE|nr:adenylate/guanylate cyclase domain-containing protein [Alteromonas aestuariivivens]RDV26724.1 adenylate/guanylate cyclase domain-containing protein [Alteromonas aestuariivivens]
MLDGIGLLLILLVLACLYGMVVTFLYLRERQQSSITEGPAVSGGLQLPVSVSEAEKQRRFQERADEAMRLSQTFQKFVPRQFVEHFAKHGSDTLELGRADEDDVAILFCDIRGFTGLSERMRPQELMNFLNSYFLRMNAPIHQNRGFIDKFIGDAIMALFDHPGGTHKDKATDALQAALDLRKALDIYNEHRRNSGYKAINIGIGVHFGPVIIGTVGSDDRMDTTVIGDSVNIAYRLEALAPKYSADIIVSAKVLETIGNDFDVQTRLLDWVRVKGRQAPIEIYEILSHLSEQEQQMRQAVEPDIRAGLDCRRNQDWDGAIEFFERALSQNPQDPLPQHHLQVCRNLRDTALDANWDGALRTL